MTPKEQIRITAVNAAIIQWNKHINRRYPNPGDYIKSLPEDVRNLLKDLKSSDIATIEDLNDRYILWSSVPEEHAPWGKDPPLWTIPNREDK